jgi:hypothetical protein
MVCCTSSTFDVRRSYFLPLKSPVASSPPQSYNLNMSFLADTPAPPLTSIVSTLDGVTTVLVAFIFVCLVLPSLVKHRSQFYAALACVIGMILVHTLALIIDTSAFILTLSGVLTGLLQIVALILLVLCVGGLTVKELAGDMAKAYEVIRRGETEKEVIIPIGDRASRGRSDDAPKKVYKINTPPPNPTPIIDPDDETEDHGIPLS